MSFQDPKPGRNRRNYNRSHYAKDLLGWFRKKTGLPWSVVLTQTVGRLDLNSPTGYTAYRELTVSVVWDENVDGPVSSWHLSNSGFYVESTCNLLRYRRA